MTDTPVLARLRVTPAMSIGPASTTITLRQRDEKFRITVIERQYGMPNPLRRLVNVDASEAMLQLDHLKQLSIPAYPISPQICDGSYWKLTIEGEFSSLSLGWWTVAPQGAERLAEFAEWLYGAAFPD